MSVKVNFNNWVVVSHDDPSFDNMQSLLTIIEREFTPKKEYNPQLRRLQLINKSTLVEKVLYTIIDDDMYIPYGLYDYIKYLFEDSEVTYHGVNNHPLLEVDNVVNNIENYSTILPGINLYDYQVEALKQIFINKRGIIQAPTGSGKTEIICAAIKIMKILNNDKFPTILLLEPTIELLKGIKERFKHYKIPVNDYRDSRTIFSNKVNIAHPKSLINDLKKDSKALSKIEVQFLDEAHHNGCSTWSELSYHIPNLIYSIGVSATFVSHYHVDGYVLNDFSYEELKRIGTCGPIIMKIDASNLIDDAQLATPKLVVLHNQANEEIDTLKYDYVWHVVRKIRLQSEIRTKLIAQAACVFAKYGRKVIIMMNILDWGRNILTEIYNLGYGDLARTCYGGQTYEKCNKKTGKIEKEYNSVLKLFDKNKIKIIIGSSCIQEGIDLSRVDVCILAQGGKSDRTTLQSVGRALRKSKTGKYAYIVDFNDIDDKMLSNQFRERMIKYKKVLGINNPNDIIKNVSIDDMENQFKLWEGIDD